MLKGSTPIIVVTRIQDSQDRLPYTAVTNPRSQKFDATKVYFSLMQSPPKICMIPSAVAHNVLAQHIPGCFSFTAPSYQCASMLTTAEKMDAGELRTGSQRLQQAVTQITSACVSLGKANCMGMINSRWQKRPRSRGKPGTWMSVSTTMCTVLVKNKREVRVSSHC